MGGLESARDCQGVPWSAGGGSRRLERQRGSRLFGHDSNVAPDLKNHELDLVQSLEALLLARGILNIDATAP
jgi:hypothetical protein